MAYSNNPRLPRVRMEAVNLVRNGWSIRKTARYMGFHHTAIIRWLRKAPRDGRKTIPTKSSRPFHHPRELKQELVSAIVSQRLKRNRCSEVIHQKLLNQHIKVSLSTVKRTLKRQNLLKQKSLWKKWHFSEPRPIAINTGDLVQIDTIHIQPLIGPRYYIYTLIDLASRWAYAEIVRKISAQRSFEFVQRAQKKAGFGFKMIQSDHGPEFSNWFTNLLKLNDVSHRHSRVRKANDNSHIERFNRTLQEECLRYEIASQKVIDKYLQYYNNERLHMGINFKTPVQVVR